MIIEQLDLRAFGRFSDESLDLSAGPRRFHLVYGPNESGKSTCLRAIRSLLFGIPSRTADNFLHANAKLRIGATLLDERGKRLTLVRRKNGKSKLYAGDDKTPIASSELELMLGGIDEATFHHRFGLSHEQLVVGGQAVLDSKGELGEILFAAGAGVGRLKAIQSQLESESKELFLERGKKTINGLLKELDDKRKELRELQTPASEYQSLRQRLAETESKSKALAEEIARTTHSLTRCKAYRDARQIVPVWRRERERLAALSPVPCLDEDFAARRREASANQNTYEKFADELRREIDQIERRIASSPVDYATLEHEKEIVSLFQSIATREAASNDQENLARIVGNKNRHLCEMLRDLDVAFPDGVEPSNVKQPEIDRLVQRLHVSDDAQIRITELAGNCEVLRQQERDALETLQSLRKQLAEIDDEIEKNPSPGDPANIDSVLTEIGSPSTLIEKSDQERATCSDLETECDRLVRELHLPDQCVENVVRMQIPTAAQIDDHDQAMGDSQRAVDNAQKHLEQLRKRKREAAERLAHLQADQPLPTESELSAARNRRDQLVDRLETVVDDRQPSQSATRDVRKSIRSADDVVDTIRSHQTQIAKRASISAELTQLDDEIVQAEATLSVTRSELADAVANWKTLWQGCGIPVGAAREMRMWIAKHQTLIEKFATLEKARVRLDLTHHRMERNASRLVAAIRNAWSERPIAVGPTEMAEPANQDVGLERLHDQASALRNEIIAAATSHQHLTRRRTEIQSAIPAAESKYESTALRRKRWDEDWKQAVAKFAGEKDASPNVISARLKKIHDLFHETRERDIVLTRIRSIDDDGRSFAARADSVAKLVGLNDAAGLTSMEIAQSLYERLQAAKANASQLEGWQRDLVDRKKRITSDSQSLAAATSQLEELCREAGVDSPDQLAEVETRASEKRTVAQAFAGAENQLMLIADAQSLETFAAEVESHDATELETEITSFENTLETACQSRSAVLEQIGALKKELSQIDGGDRAAALNQELQLLSGRIERESLRYAKLRIASMILHRSIEHYRTENESPVLRLACEAFEDLTCGRYIALRPEYDDKGHSKLFGVERSSGGEESLVAVQAMSLGTADAVYLALRLASLEHQLAAGHAIPVVIDDCLIQLDDDRTVAAMKRFSKLSEQTQVILFTHHQHLIELAQSSMQPGDYHLHHLAG